MMISYEEQIERKLKGAMLGLKNGTKTKQDVAQLLMKLKTLNPHLAADYINDYKALLEDWKVWS